MQRFNKLYVAPGLSGATALETRAWHTPFLDPRKAPAGYDGLRGDDSSTTPAAPVPTAESQAAFGWTSVLVGGLVGYLLGRFTR